MNASGEPAVDQALIHSIHPAQLIKMLLDFIKWNGLNLLQALVTALRYAQPRRSLLVITMV